MTEEDKDKMKRMEQDIAEIKTFTNRLSRELFGDPEFQQPGLMDTLHWLQKIKNRHDSGVWTASILIGLLSVAATMFYIIAQVNSD